MARVADFDPPSCYFCGDASYWSGLNTVLVRAVGESPSEAKPRRVCDDCLPDR